MPLDKNGLLWFRIEGRLSSYSQDALRTMPYDEWKALYAQVREHPNSQHRVGRLGFYLWRIDQWKGKAEIHRLKKEHKELLRREEETQRLTQLLVEAVEDRLDADYADC